LFNDDDSLDFDIKENGAEVGFLLNGAAMGVSYTTNTLDIKVIDNDALLDNDKVPMCDL